MAPAGMGTDVAEIPRGTEIGATGIARGWNLFLREPRADALDILPMIKNLMQALQYWVNCRVKWLHGRPHVGANGVR